MDRLRRDALAIWHAGLEAVRSDRLVREALRLEGRWLIVGDEPISLAETDRIAVVGAGKAGAGMAAAVQSVLGPRLAAEKQLAGWVNVPADCVGPSQCEGDSPSFATISTNAGGRLTVPAKMGTVPRIHLHAARPPGVNEPTAAGVAGTLEILRRVESLGPRDLCLCLISGGGSALLPAPAEGVSLEDKLAVTRHLSAAGANIEQLNAVRKRLSRIKGGGLARACRAGRLVTLIISDVLGDPLDVIASGPTVEDTSTAAMALAVLEQFRAREAGVPAHVLEYLRRPAPAPRQPACRVTNLVIGNNATAVDAAGQEAERRGYSHAMVCASHSEGLAEDVGRHLAEMALRMRAEPGPDCLISGGEPVVRLVEASRRGRGGRNQQLALAALDRLGLEAVEDLAVLAGSTDGEDGPTDAAGAFFDAELARDARQRRLVPGEFLARNDAYHFFGPLGGLLRTGPTHTNVCDVRVVLVDRAAQ